MRDTAPYIQRSAYFMVSTDRFRQEIRSRLELASEQGGQDQTIGAVSFTDLSASFLFPTNG
jgi:hypothetical protein